MIGNKIKNIRELKNFTQEYMAEKLDISQAAYSKLEKGDIKVSSDKLSQIAKILDVNPEDITAFDSQKYFNSFNNVKGSNNGSIIIGADETELIKKLYEDKISLLEKLLSNTEKELKNYKTKYGEL
ncbi:transcriptional regulator with XRE-family HTH domain [Chryseobacterium bernardetii]|uniref:Transcriptional regulator with XRE-family HTH domain n=1 Tax=Chryseobacterium bernardetii TaxID=1241978 RepID=A0ACC6IQ15_9FLAO|nr:MULTISPECIES: helix-turn-helix transcriptional regulator [Chryseobacterium]MDR6369391.1 transcriptional regulator with XRE-family HTH domain [Chryseobacterium vietnamense]MDR6439687.1 transcriptional regulator with XRE-family HTH domain [Chryseobacterium bernardetii]